MLKKLVVPAVAAVALGAAVTASAGGAKDSFDLKGEVYATGFKIEMKNGVNRPLRTVKAGTYRVKIEDKASFHNFHLTGPGVNKKTTVGGTAEQIWTVRLKPGTYTFVCDPHAAQMRGSFRVT
jgi:plastocyanin